MAIQYPSPNFSDWPPENTFSGKVIPNFVKGYLRMKIDAEWRATCLKDHSFYDWMISTFNWEHTIRYLIITQKIEARELEEWESEIRGRYDWSQKG